MSTLAALINHARMELVTERAITVATVQRTVAVGVLPTAALSRSAGKMCPLNTCCSEFGFVGTRLKDKLQSLYIPEQLLIYHSVVRRKSFVRVRSV